MRDENNRSAFNFNFNVDLINEHDEIDSYIDFIQDEWDNYISIRLVETLQPNIYCKYTKYLIIPYMKDTSTDLFTIYGTYNKVMGQLAQVHTLRKAILPLLKG